MIISDLYYDYVTEHSVLTVLPGSVQMECLVIPNKARVFTYKFVTVYSEETHDVVRILSMVIPFAPASWAFDRLRGVSGTSIDDIVYITADTADDRLALKNTVIFRD